MMHYFDVIISWYQAHLNYGPITLLMAIESSFVPLPSELVIPPAAYLAVQGQLNLGLVILFSTIGCIIGALFNRMAPALWVIAVLSNITVIHRILYTWRQTQILDAAHPSATRAA